MSAAKRKPDQALTNLRRRLERAELHHLREHALELHQQTEALAAEVADLRRRLEYAEWWAESWRQDALEATQELADDQGGAIGLRRDGSLTIVPAQAAAEGGAA